MFKWRSLKEAGKADDGAILALWGVSFAALLGIVAMSFDLGRVNVTQSELQSFADNVALAAAGELDGGAGAISRATAAAAAMVSDTQTYGNANNVLSGGTDYNLTFLSDLPGSDTAAPTSTTNDGKKARYVLVTVNNATVDLTFGAAFTGLTGANGPNNVVNARAVAGFTSYACDIAPLTFCVPSGWRVSANIGQMINLHSQGGASQWTAGGYGFLDPSKLAIDPNGVCGSAPPGQQDDCLIGAEGPITQCFAQNGVDIEPGQKTGQYDAFFNVRFDIYVSTMNGNKNTAKYQPAPNVIKGIIPTSGNCIGAGNGAGQAPSPDTIALPRDTCFAAGTCANGNRFGNGVWNRTTYVGTNHGGVDPITAIGGTGTTRWAMYNAEITQAGANLRTNPLLSNTLSESGRPSCSNNMSTDPNRRVVFAAAIDCTSTSITGAQTGIPVLEYVELFLTEPVKSNGTTSPPTTDIWAEVIGSGGGANSGPGPNGVFHDFVQLFR